MDEGRRNVEDPCHVVTRVFKRQRVQFGDDLIFREVLGADPDLPGVLPGALTAGGLLAAGPFAVAGSLAATSGKSGYGENYSQQDRDCSFMHIYLHVEALCAETAR